MTAQIGANPAVVETSAERLANGRAFSLGDSYTDYRGFEFVYVKAAGTLGKNMLVKISADYAAIATATLNAPKLNFAHMYGVVASATVWSADSYGWVQVRGEARCRVSATGTHIGPMLLIASSATPGCVTPTASASTTTPSVRLVGMTIKATATVSSSILVSADSQSAMFLLTYPQPFITDTIA